MADFDETTDDLPYMDSPASALFDAQTSPHDITSGSHLFGLKEFPPVPGRFQAPWLAEKSPYDTSLRLPFLLLQPTPEPRGMLFIQLAQPALNFLDVAADKRCHFFLC